MLATAGSALAFTPNDADWSLTWPQTRVKMSRTWNLTRGSGQVIVAVVDSGVNPNFRDFRGALVPGRDFVSGGYTKVDDDGHGTEMASIIAARGNNGSGIPGYCWSCKVMPVRVSDGTTTSNTLVAEGINWAADHGAQIITISSSEEGDQPADPGVAAAIAYAARKGILVLASAGNTYGSTRYTYPAADPGAYAVAGTNKFDQLSPWSTKGSWIHLAAPGCQLALSRRGRGIEPCGTSVSAPAVAGIAGLMLSVNPSLTSGQIISIIEHTSKPVAGIGGGRIDAYAAVRAAAARAAVRAGGTVLFRRLLRGEWHLGLSVQGKRVAATLRSPQARACSLSLQSPDAIWLSGTPRPSAASLVARVSSGKYRLEISCKVRRLSPVSLTVRAFSH